MGKKSEKITKFVLFFFLFGSVIIQPVSSQAANIWEKRKGAVQDMKNTAEETTREEIEEPALDQTSRILREPSIDLTDPSEIIIPEQYGTIIETHDGTNGRLVVHIQDAHMNYEGQKNLANILGSLIEDYGLNLVLLEGKVSDLNFDYIRERATLDERVEKADGLLKEGYINGVNYLNIASDYGMDIQGIENKDIYDANIAALWEIDKFKGPALEYIDRLLAVSNALKPRIYNKDLMELDTKKNDYDTEGIDLVEYYEYLYSKAEEKDIPLYVFPNFQNLIKASEIEKKIDLAKIRTGEASDDETALYNDYLEATRALNVNALFKEEPKIEDFLKDTLTENPDQRSLLRISKALTIMKNLLKVKVVPEEYAYFRDNKKDFDPKAWSDFLNKKSTELNLSLDIPANYYIISDNLRKIEGFYQLAAEREDVFLIRAQEHMRSGNVNLAALVAGGFHTPSLTKLLEKEGYSYIVISPKVTTETDDELYRTALKREWMPEIQRRVK